jgi:hypothetical protein
MRCLRPQVDTGGGGTTVVPAQILPVNAMEQARRGRPDEGCEEEGRAYYGHIQGAYGGG